MKLFAHLVASIFAAAIALVLTFLIVVRVQVAIYGRQAFEHDAGASFAVSMFGIVFAIPAAIATFAIVFWPFRVRSQRVARL